jgi:hypothetical protein
VARRTECQRRIGEGPERAERNTHAPKTQCIHEEGYSEAESKVGSQEIGNKEAESHRQNGSSDEKAIYYRCRSTPCRSRSTTCLANEALRLQLLN